MVEVKSQPSKVQVDFETTAEKSEVLMEEFRAAGGYHSEKTTPLSSVIEHMRLFGINRKKKKKR